MLPVRRAPVLRQRIEQFCLYRVIETLVEGLGEGEMPSEHEPQASVSTAFLNSPILGAARVKKSKANKLIVSV